MGLNDTPSAGRVHIGFFGRRNAGKSSLVNAVTGQEIAIVSEVKGTTTDPVYKSMEILPLGPVVIIDTPGFDDEGELGRMRVERARRVIEKTDLAVLVVDAGESPSPGECLRESDRALAALLRERNIPFLTVFNKADLGVERHAPCEEAFPSIFVSAKTGYNVRELRERIAGLLKNRDEKPPLVADLVHAGDFVALVTPIDKAAPKGRLILPQQQTIRDILEADAAAIVVKEFELRQTLESLGKRPSLVITDSQVFAKVSADTPEDIPLTSFSILFARYKGFLETAVRGVKALDGLKTGSRVLVCEGCTHHRQCDDIGTVKIPRWIRQHLGPETEVFFSFCSGGDFPGDLSGYDLVIHCGACMLNDRETRFRQRSAGDQGVPFTNYGLVIAHIQGILRRSLSVFPHVLSLLES